jgi:hypothetical protein
MPTDQSAYPLVSQVTGCPFISTKRLSITSTLQAKRALTNRFRPFLLSANPITYPHFPGVVPPSWDVQHLNCNVSPFRIRRVKSTEASTIPQCSVGSLNRKTAATPLCSQ